MGGWGRPGGAAASEPAGLLPPMAGAGGGGQLCVSPPAPRRRNTGCPGWPRGAECFWGDGKMVVGMLGGGLGGPALCLAGAGGAAGGAACAFPGILLLIPSVVGEKVPGARGAVGEKAGLVGGRGGVSVPPACCRARLPGTPSHRSCGEPARWQPAGRNLDHHLFYYFQDIWGMLRCD